MQSPPCPLPLPSLTHLTHLPSLPCSLPTPSPLAPASSSLSHLVASFPPFLPPPLPPLPPPFKSREKFLHAQQPKPLPRLAAPKSETVESGAGNGHRAEWRSTLREICGGLVPDHVLRRAEELGFEFLTEIQREALPILLSGKDCVIHSQTGSGKTFCYLLAILSKVVASRSAVQAIVVVPTRELGIQVVRVARMLGGKSSGSYNDHAGSKEEKNVVNVMALFDGGTLNRQKRWIKAEPPQVLVGTLDCICKMIETNHLRSNSVTTIVVDEVDEMISATKQAGLLQKFLTVHTSSQKRQTIFVSATLPHQSRFIRDLICEKWAKDDLVHVQVHYAQKLPSKLIHRFVLCEKNGKLDMLIPLLQVDLPRAAIIFVNEQSEKSKRAGMCPMTKTIAELLSTFYLGSLNGEAQLMRPLVLEEQSNINARYSSLYEFQGGRQLLVATDLAARGLDLPEVSHVYNFDLPSSATAYLHRAGRTGRRPFSEDCGFVTSLITEQELFVFNRFQNELMFDSVQLPL